MNTAIVYTTGRQGPDRSSLEWREAFCAGLQRRGWKARLSTSPDPGADLLVMWGVRRGDAIARQKAHGGQVCILERGYLGDRFSWTSVSFGGGLNGRGAFRMPETVCSARFDRLGIEIAPWRRQDGYALLIGQVPGDMSIRGVEIEAWYRQTAAALVRQGWEVRFRPHPLAGRACSAAGLAQIGGTLAEAMQGAGLVVTFNSNTGVEAAVAGRPVIAMDAGSMAWDVAGHQVDEIITPDRAEWAHRLAWRQWSKNEMISGECQEAVGL
jgi:hypothetical protein